MVRAMTTLKPQLVRADTLDLQDLGNPSAKDHTRQPTHPSPYGYGPAAPHQAQTLRHAQEEEYQQQRTSPHTANDHNGGNYATHQRFYDDPEDEADEEHLMHLQGANGTTDHGQDFDDADGDMHDDDMDDDLMDKISSSPSIEDGKSPLPQWPPRADSMDVGASPALILMPTRGSLLLALPSSFDCTPSILPLHLRKEEVCVSKSHLGEELSTFKTAYANLTLDDRNTIGESWQYHDRTTPATTHLNTTPPEIDLETQEIVKYLLPIDDPLLDNAFDQSDEGFEENENDWEDEDESIADYRSSTEDDSEEFPFSIADRFIDSGWGGECLREVEDIDFEFVYALHTFVATVEGQANATKGDTMVLLDDSNSYWWLVRVVKDGSIGYLPAEHIETPTERLARLNKHRNIDLSASMLGDNPEKSKNPLKKAMRRRNAKTVQFTAPTYYDATDYEYSDEEDGDDSIIEPVENGVHSEDVDTSQGQQGLNIGGPVQGLQPLNNVNGIKRVTSEEELTGEPTSPNKNTPTESAPIQSQPQDPVSRSRAGVVRNTDSFFKDENAETKKMTLTPRLLRGDSDSNGSAEQIARPRQSLESSSDSQPREEKKKEKKGMLSGLFKRKDKGGKGTRPEDKFEEPSHRGPQAKDSIESLSKAAAGPERKTSKLSKPTQGYVSPQVSPTETRAQQHNTQAPIQTSQPSISTEAIQAPASVQGQNQIQPTVRQVDQNADHIEEQQGPSSQLPVKRFPSLQEKRPVFTADTNNLRHTPTSSVSGTEAVAEPIHTNVNQTRYIPEENDDNDVDRTPTEAQMHAGAQPSTYNRTGSQTLRTDSGMQMLQNDHLAHGSAPMANMTSGLIDDTDDEQMSDNTGRPLQRGTEFTPVESEPTESTSKPSPSTAVHTPSTSRSTPTWSDASLRSYMENSQDIKDLLIIVHDKSNVTPVGSDHPLMTNLFSNERTKLAEMQSQLDLMLMGWMSRKNQAVTSR